MRVQFACVGRVRGVEAGVGRCNDPKDTEVGGDVGGEVEKEFRDNRAFFQRSGKWACPVCFWATNTGFSQVRVFFLFSLVFCFVPPSGVRGSQCL